MKKLVLIAACMVAIAAGAQEKKGGLAAELGLGITQLGNYSPVSVMADNTDKYSLLPTELITLGYQYNNGNFMGATFNIVGGNTSHIEMNEEFMDINAMFNFRHAFALKNNFELEAGVAIGLLIHNNFFDWGNDNHESYTRFGSCGNFSIGLNYKLDNNSYVGIRATLPYFGTLMGEKPELPVPLSANEKTMLSGYQLMLHWGLRF